MFDVIVCAKSKSHLLFQTVNSLIGGTDQEMNLIVRIGDASPAQARNRALEGAHSRYVFFADPDVFVHAGTLDAMLKMLEEGYDLVTVRSLLSEEADEGLFGIDTHTLTPSNLSFDEVYLKARFTTRDFFEQMKQTKHKVVAGEWELSHAPVKGDDTMDEKYFLAKWASIRHGETTWLNPSKGY